MRKRAPRNRSFDAGKIIEPSFRCSAAGAGVVIASRPDGSIVRLSDVARVIDSVENNRVQAWSNGVPAVLMIIRRQPGANIVRVRPIGRRRRVRFEQFGLGFCAEQVLLG